MNRIALSVVIILLAGCGSGGGEGGSSTPSPSSPSQPVTATGVFKDANVEGLTYASGDQSGLTDAESKFVYEVGETVEFSVGGVNLGSSDGKGVIMPVDLVPGGTIDSVEVLNIVRFLLMLDGNGDPSDGILIPEFVRERAEEWLEVDFSDADLETQLEFIIPDARSASGGTHLLPSNEEAKDHLTATFYCVHSGGFRGTFAGDEIGWFGIMIERDGSILAFGSMEGDEAGFDARGAIVSTGQGANFLTGETNTDATFGGSFSTPDDLIGEWSRPDLGESGTFEASRVAGSINAEYRFTGHFETAELSSEHDVGLFVIDVDDVDEVSGVIYSLPYDELVTVSGVLDGEVLTGSTATGSTFSGSLDKANGTMSGNWEGSNSFGTFEGLGCALN